MLNLSRDDEWVAGMSERSEGEGGKIRMWLGG
jgi:hypothetical protein